MFCSSIAALLLSSLFPTVVYSAVDVSSLKPLLSPGASVGNSAPRWSEFAAPMPGAVINVANEVDVQTTVKWAVSRNIRFLTQNGGNGWATTFKIGSNDIVINLGGLRSITFDSEKTEVTVAGGALISDVVQAASSAGRLVATGSCNCVGYLGAVLGGGIGPLQGQYGLGVDELISLNIVLANGTAASVSPSSNTDLWYALRGAAPNFAIVTSAVARAHPAPEEGLQAWAGSLLFRPDQLEAIVGAIGQLTISAKMALTLTFINQAATNSQIIIASPFYLGTADAGRRAFESLIRIGPFSDGTAVIPYTSWNNGSNNACVKGGRRPTWGVGLERMDPTIWRKVYNVWLDLIKEPGAERSSILLNAYATEKVLAAPDSSSAVPWRRSISFHASMTAFYTDAAFDSKALEYGKKARSLWRSSSKDCSGKVYINNAFGDEPTSVIYGASLPRLSALKRKFDPNRRFDQWFPI